MKLIRNFWWGDEPDKRKVDWIAWEKMMMPKFMGGPWLSRYEAL